MLIILDIDPSSLGTVEDTARIPFSVVKRGSPGLAPNGLSEKSPNRPGLVDGAVSVLFSLLAADSFKILLLILF